MPAKTSFRRETAAVALCCIVLYCVMLRSLPSRSCLFPPPRVAAAGIRLSFGRLTVSFVEFGADVRQAYPAGGK